MHPDMESERRQPSFDVERLTNILDGGAENTALRRKVGKEVGVGRLLCVHKLFLEGVSHQHFDLQTTTFALKTAADSLWAAGRLYHQHPLSPSEGSKEEP